MGIVSTFQRRARVGNVVQSSLPTVLEIETHTEVTVFFMIQGSCVVVEEVKKQLGGRRQLNKVVSRVLTLGFMGVTAIRPIGFPMIENGIDEKAIRECHVTGNFLKEKAGLIVALIAESLPWLLHILVNNQHHS